VLMAAVRLATVQWQCVRPSSVLSQCADGCQVGYTGSASSAVVTYSSTDEAARALSSSEVVLGCHDVQLHPLSADSHLSASDAGVVEVLFQH